MYVYTIWSNWWVQTEIFWLWAWGNAKHLWDFKKQKRSTRKALKNVRCKVGIITDNQIISSKSWWTHVYKIWYRKWYGKVDTCSKLHKTKSLNQSEHSMWHHLLQTNSNSIGNTVPRTSWQQTKVCLTHCPSICRTWLNKRNDKAEVRPSSSSKLVLMLHCLTSHCKTLHCVIGWQSD